MWGVRAKTVFSSAGPTLDETDRFRDIACASAESAKHEDRLTGFERDAGLLGDSGHCSLVALDSAVENDARPNVAAHAISHRRQSLRPFVLMRFMRMQSEPFFPLQPPAVQRQENQVHGGFMFGGERCQLG